MRKAFSTFKNVSFHEYVYSSEKKKTNSRTYIVSEKNHATTCRFAVTTMQDEKQSGKIASKLETCIGQ